MAKYMSNRSIDMIIRTWQIKDLLTFYS